MEPEVKKEKLPPGMFKRGRIYYVKKMINGEMQKQSTGKKDYKAAFKRYLAIMNDWDKGIVQPKTMTFAAYWTHYRATKTIRKTPRPDGKYSDDYLIAGPLAYFGPMPLTTIRPIECQQFVQARLTRRIETKNQKGEVVAVRPVAASTVAREVAFLKAVFRQAVNAELLPRSPMRGIEKLAFVQRERVLSHEEQGQLETVLSPRYYRWLLFMLGTGLRIEEARGINPKVDLDLDKRTVRVTRKTRGLLKKVQMIPLFDDDVVAVLREQLEQEGELWPACQWTIREVLDLACSKVGITDVSPHTLRHTFATRYLQAGGDIFMLSKLMGHSSVRTTEKVYAHLVHEDLLAASKHIKMGLRPAAAGKLLEFKKEA